ncbi:MAG: HAD family phosphatase [Bryobacteraceae bacterium]|nr:HAD family phosphatase [Bryobacteraceae bacterium]
MARPRQQRSVTDNCCEAIFFDFDGVLADTEPLHYRAWRDALEPLGFDFTWEVYRSDFIGLSDSDLVRRLARRATPPLDPAALWARFPEKQRLFLRFATADPPISQPTIDMIFSLVHYKLAIVTSTSISEIRPILRAAGIEQRFQTIVASEDVARHKPDPEPSLLAMQRLAVTRGLAIEDSDAGERSAHAAGLEVLKVHSPAEVPERVAHYLAQSRAC